MTVELVVDDPARPNRKRATIGKRAKPEAESRLSFIAVAAKQGNNVMWRCRCVCGKIVVVRACRVRSMTTRSCGCLARELTVTRSLKHGHNRRGKRSKLYAAWAAMHDRCSRQTNHDFVNMVVVGFRVCRRWASFHNFIADMAPRPAGMTLDRKDVNGNYTLANCRWVSRTTQARNTRRNRLMAHEAGQIRWLVCDGGVAAKLAAETFNCSTDTVYLIKTGRQWSDAW